MSILNGDTTAFYRSLDANRILYITCLATFSQCKLGSSIHVGDRSTNARLLCILYVRPLCMSIPLLLTDLVCMDDDNKNTIFAVTILRCVLQKKF